MKYRYEVDGLRALAVVPVVIAHSGLPLMPGGFTGVDVFFVISGYLITKILRQDLASGSFSYLSFYERRARRIIPALFLVLLFSLIAGGAFLTPAEFDDLQLLSALAVVFSSNIHFAAGIGYFDPAAEFNPLIHTWSLGVEEQFYLIYPFFLLWVLKRFPARALVFLTLLTVVGLVLAQWGVRKRPDFAFYLLPFRAWELLLGAGVAFLSDAREGKYGTSLRSNEVPSAVGLLLIIVGFFFIDETMEFPGVLALIPAIGTALILLFGTSETFVGRVLSLRALVQVGTISFGLYLWHQPLLAFLRRDKAGASFEEPAILEILIAVACTFIFAAVSWRWVEFPIRRRLVLHSSRSFLIAILAASGLIALVSIGARYTLVTGGAPNVQYESLGQKIEERGDVCELSGVAGFDGVLGCDFGDISSNRVVVLYGDSHAQAVSYFLNDRFKEVGIRGVRARLAGCEFLPGIIESGRAPASIDRCNAAIAMLERFLIQNAADVIVIGRWSYRLFPVPGEIEALDFSSSEGVRERPNKHRVYVAKNDDGRIGIGAAGKLAAIDRFIGSLLATGRNVFVVYPVPEVGTDIYNANARYFRDKGEVLQEISIPEIDYRKRNRFVEDALSSFEGRSGFHGVQPYRVFCNTFEPGRCVAQFDGVPFYLDDDHLSDHGAELLFASLFR